MKHDWPVGQVTRLVMYQGVQPPNSSNPNLDIAWQKCRKCNLFEHYCAPYRFYSCLELTLGMFLVWRVFLVFTMLIYVHALLSVTIFQAGLNHLLWIGYCHRPGYCTNALPLEAPA